MCLAKVPNALLELLYWKMSNPFDESMAGCGILNANATVENVAELCVDVFAKAALKPDGGTKTNVGAVFNKAFPWSRQVRARFPARTFVGAQIA